MKNKDILERMGLSDKESTIYLALLETGPATISTISKKTGVHRPLIYKALPTLQEKGLVSSGPKGKLTQYIPEPPERLTDLFDDLEGKFYDLLPELKSAYAHAGNRPVVKFLEGKEGIKTIFNDLVSTVKRGDVTYRYSAQNKSLAGRGYLPKDYEKRRNAKQLERMVITSETRAREKAQDINRNIKTIPKDYDLFDDEITQLIFGDKVAFLDYESDTATVIESRKFANFQRKIFKLLYKKL